jgi:hypothetical protein
MSRLKYPVTAFITAGIVLAFSSGRAAAQDQAAVDKLVQMNKKALEDYDTLEWDSAKRILLEALVTGKKAGLENHPIMARTYVHLGAVYFAGLKDHNKALQSFVRALEIDPSIRLARNMSTPELEEVFADAQAKAGGGGGGGGGGARESGGGAPPPPPAGTRKRRGFRMENESAAPPPPERTRSEEPAPSDDESGEPDLPLHINALDCPNADETPPDRAVTVRCAVSPSLKVESVVLFYRLPGKEDFINVTMEKTPKGWFQGKIPKKAVGGKSLQFYFEGRNAAGKPIVANGGAGSPNVMLIREEEEAKEAERENRSLRGRHRDNEDENPLEERVNTGPRIFLGRVDKSKVGLDERYGKRKWWVGLGFGSGFGYAKGTGFETRSDLNANPGYQPGFAWAGLGHLAIELGYQVNPDFAISIQTRDQLLPPGGTYSQYVASGAHAVLARALFFTKQSQTRFYGSLMAGGGEGIRFVANTDDGNGNTYRDTVRGGPGLAGAGGGVYYELSKPVSLVAELNLLAGVPNFSLSADINFHLQVNIY